jgi:hypothetical protein
MSDLFSQNKNMKNVYIVVNTACDIARIVINSSSKDAQSNIDDCS